MVELEELSEVYDLFTTNIQFIALVYNSCIADRPSQLVAMYANT